MNGTYQPFVTPSSHDVRIFTWTWCRTLAIIFSQSHFASLIVSLFTSANDIISSVIWLYVTFASKSLLEALILASTSNPQYNMTKDELVVFMYRTGKSMNNLMSYCVLFSWRKNKCFWKRFTCKHYFILVVKADWT